MSDPKELYKRFINNECSDSEITELLKYLDTHPDVSDELVASQFKAEIKASETGKNQAVLQMVKYQINSRLHTSQKETKANWPTRLAFAASVLICLSVVTYFWLPKKTAQPLVQTQPHDVAPGHNQATLTLANGQTFKLNAGKTGVVINANRFAYNDGTKITGPATNTGWQTISTPKGGQYQLVLPDGSKIWLNAATTLKFQQSFTGLRSRMVELSGEAYFEVAKDKTRPFIVKSKLQNLQVLGTHFNVAAYEDESITKSTLLEGSIKINNTIQLKPGEQADNSGSAIRVEQVDTDNAVAWKNGEFMFRKEPLESIMRKIARWYDVKIIYADEQQKQKLFGGTISRFANVSEILNTLELTWETIVSNYG